MQEDLPNNQPVTLPENTQAPAVSDQQTQQPAQELDQVGKTLGSQLITPVTPSQDQPQNQRDVSGKIMIAGVLAMCLSLLAALIFVFLR